MMHVIAYVRLVRLGGWRNH